MLQGHGHGGTAGGRASQERCTVCGELRPRLTGGRCIGCVGADPDRSRMEALVAYVREHPGVTIAEVSTALGVSPGRVEGLIDAGRLELSDAPGR